MWRDYLRLFWLGVRHNKINTLINVGGLALGLAVFIALSFYVYREFSWDDHWQDAERIYRVVGTVQTANADNPSVWPIAPWPLGTILQTRNPDAFAAYARVYVDGATLQLGADEYPEQLVSYTEPGLLDLIQLQTLEGSLQDVFSDPRAIALEITQAQKLFGDRSLLGETITLTTPQRDSADYVIKAIYRLPQPTSLDLPILALLDPTAQPRRNMQIDLWEFRALPQSQPAITQAPVFAGHYFKLRPGFPAEAIAADLHVFMEEHHRTHDMRYQFQQLQRMHLGASLDHRDNVQRLWVYAVIGLLVLLISGCNFVMLATLRSVDRMREVGIRKSLGGEAGQLLRSYLVDALLLTTMAACLALSLLEVGVPALQASLAQVPDFTLGWRGVITCIGIVIGFALLSGLYPAWLMSRGRPATLLRSSGGSVAGGNSALPTLLVGLQFAIVIALLLASSVIQQQIDYVQQRSRGFSLDHVLGAYFPNQQHSAKATTLVEEFERVPGVEGAAVSIAPGAFTSGGPTLYRSFAIGSDAVEAQLDGASVGPGYFGVMSVPLLAGREFSLALDGGPPPTETTPDTPGEMKVVLNESAVRALGFPAADAAIGKLVERERCCRDEQVFKQNMRVIGVVADMQFVSLLLPPVPQAYTMVQSNSFVSAKLAPGADVADVRAALEERWHAVLGDAPFSPRFGTELISNQLQREEFEARIATGSSALAIVIALLGLYGLAAANVMKRIKEIGVRKVMGADTFKIVALLLWQFSRPVVLANLAAWPLGVWAILRWLERFPFRLDTWNIVWSGLAASGLALGIAWLTVGFLAARAASQRPVLALRYE